MSEEDNFSMNYQSTLCNIGASLLVETKLLGDSYNTTYQDISRKIIETEDNLIKKGLKGLGWISPEEGKKIQYLLRQVAGEQSSYRGGWSNVDEELKDILTGVFNDTTEI